MKGVVTTDRSVLLVEETHADGTPFWTLPGGGVLPDESAPDALRREITEELGCRCVVDRPVDAFPYVHHSLRETASMYTVYNCQLLTDPRPTGSDEIAELDWVDADALPARTLPQVRSVVQRLFDE